MFGGDPVSGRHAARQAASPACPICGATIGACLDQGMDYEVIGAALAVVGALLWIRRDLRADLRHEIGEVRGEIGEVRADIRALNGRIDAVLLARSSQKTG